MRLRWSRGLGLLARTGLLLSAVWLAYTLLTRSASQAPGEDGGRRSLREREANPATGRPMDPARPIYSKADPDPSAPGEWGRAARLTLTGDEKKQEEDSLERYAINIYVSDHISLHRHIQDNRMYECRSKKYEYQHLPTTSVIIAFYNEAWSTLLRTIHSVLETTPAVLLKEVILVDDFSDRGDFPGGRGLMCSFLP